MIYKGYIIESLIDWALEFQGFMVHADDAHIMVAHFPKGLGTTARRGTIEILEKEGVIFQARQIN